ncbi:MAG: hypothetical protein HOJ57_16565 [Lentisphaerae bacterium]|nr:hypothetical protein [Lentisphaerota bacterium]MBT7054583.1 hypothetical protein [Lentisphaerota bacterium]
MNASRNRPVGSLRSATSTPGRGILTVLGMNDDRTMGFGNGSTGNGPMPDGYLEAGFPKPGPWNARLGKSAQG